MTKVTTRPEIDLIVVIGDNHLEMKVGMYRIMERTIDRIIGVDGKTVMEMTLGEEIVERYKIIEVGTTEVDVGTVIETVIETIKENITEMTTEILKEIPIEMTVKW